MWNMTIKAKLTGNGIVIVNIQVIEKLSLAWNHVFTSTRIVITQKWQYVLITYNNALAAW